MTVMSPGHSVPRRGFSRGDLVVRAAIIALLVASFVLLTWTLWLAGQLGGLLHGTWPAASPLQAPHIAGRLLAHPGTPATAWPAPARTHIPGPGLLYPLWALLLTGHSAAAMWAGVRLVKRFGRGRGFARRSDLDKLLTADAVLAKVDIWRPALIITDADSPQVRADKQRRRADPLEVARYMGDDAQTDRPLYVPIEFGELGEGVPRMAAKTQRCIIPRVLDARGPVLTTSTRLDVASITFETRSRLGPTFIFEPQGKVPGVPRLRWSPIHGCEDQVTAMVRAKGFAAGSGVGGKGVENGEWFENQAAMIIRGLLHAAALDEATTMTDVVTWAQNPANSRPERILRHHGVTAWAERLMRHRESGSRTRDIIADVVSGALDAFNDPRVLASVCPPRGNEFDPAEWLHQRGTLFLVGTSSTQASVAPLFSAIIEDLVYRALEAALLAEGGRCEPVPHFVLDEIRNIAPIPSLPNLMSEGGGSGLAISAFCQNTHQLTERWGRDGGKAIVGSANVRFVFGGSLDPDSLRDVQTLAGQVSEVTAGASFGGGRASVNESVRREHLLGVTDIRTLPVGQALVFAGNLAPVVVRMPAWWERRDAAALTADRATFQARIAKAA